MTTHFKEIAPEALRKNTFQLIGKDWMLLAAGNEQKVNAMTASWGGLGVMYGKNVAFIVVRPQRYTKEFIDREDTFSLTFFDKKYKDVLSYMGSMSGRVEDKIAKSGLTLARTDDTPYFEEAGLVFLCKKLFHQPISGDAFVDDKINSTWYPSQDYHTLYIAEITKVLQASRPQ